MWIEADTTESDAQPWAVCVGMEVGEMDEQAIEIFNASNKHAFAILQKKTSHMLASVTEYVLIQKRYPEEDSTENLAPFDSSQEAESFLYLFKGIATMGQVLLRRRWN